MDAEEGRSKADQAVTDEMRHTTDIDPQDDIDHQEYLNRCQNIVLPSLGEEKLTARLPLSKWRHLPNT